VARSYAHSETDRITSYAVHFGWDVVMSNALKGMIAGFVATLVLSGLIVLNSTMDLVPQINIIRLVARPWLSAPGNHTAETVTA
jgi:hypothetical protein